MYAQVSRIQIQKGKIEEAIIIFESSVLPLVRQQKGFKKFFLLVDRIANQVIVTNLWENEADITGLLESGFYQEQVAKFAAIFDGGPERNVYEVAVEA